MSETSRGMTNAFRTGQSITLTGTGELLSSLAHAPNPAETRRFALLIFCQQDAQLRLLDDGESIVIGRKEPAEVVIRDDAISKQHVRLLRKRDEVWVEDLDSRHGTFVGGRRIKHERLAAFEEVSFGKARVVLAATSELRAPSSESARAGDAGLVISNARIRRMYEQAELAARGLLPVLVLGETGSGKEHLVRAFHRASPRHAQELVAVNCAAIAPSLLESTLFGHERGAFTGAHQRHIGVFERADGGVLFLDEVGDLSANAQVALLRALETKKITRLGSSSEIAVDVQVIAATHCDLASMVDDGTFRRDLYFRLNGIQLDVPPLRERSDEIEPMARLFLERACTDWSLSPRTLSAEALLALQRCRWPGNVRQLRYAIERAALLATNAEIGVNDLPEYVSDSELAPADDAVAHNVPAVSFDLGLKQQLKRYEQALIEQALRQVGGNRQAAAKLLRVPLRTLFRRLRAVGSSEDVQVD